MSLRHAVLMQSRMLLRSRRPFSTISATDEANILKELDELKTKTKKAIIEDVEKVKRLENEDRNALNRLLTSCGMPRGAFRDKLVFGCHVVELFAAFSAVGIWKAGRDAPHKDAKFATDASI
ncbi:Os03g0583300 [Oryza sativa Japonica Group]|uniref:Os03g0583300 protein n=2 Tax=Oryza sativa subsp. japonica TaxID=39947 RepID=Q75IB8_ORYSJ|nr:hypothetical protein [Oryza sativa Japonica Group]ABF97322.1 hypothetical protein LOC_Os03g38680 [Oryza sativa Japonica Group]EAZ27608.1 hypothetical protein OsJ_11554 [Oryza sativa Japonica Group]BAS85072.1 Os03g0583300 [Oryza sativa Japonica Group]